MHPSDALEGEPLPPEWDERMLSARFRYQDLLEEVERQSLIQDNLLETYQSADADSPMQKFCRPEERAQHITNQVLRCLRMMRSRLQKDDWCLKDADVRAVFAAVEKEIPQSEQEKPSIATELEKALSSAQANAFIRTLSPEERAFLVKKDKAINEHAEREVADLSPPAYEVQEAAALISADGAAHLEQLGYPVPEEQHDVWRSQVVIWRRIKDLLDMARQNATAWRRLERKIRGKPPV